ncbi:MAG: type II toxin-antitoxin system HicA family toxin [Chitinispirillales bacterium]|nr:type II toxin-antitoxin system HicA family toxin [Chitinispirillales bacterium]
MKPAEIIKTLEKFGFVYKSQKGSHVKCFLLSRFR